MGVRANSIDIRAAWAYLERVIAPALTAASPHYLSEIRSALSVEGVVAAVTCHDTPRLFDWLVRASQFQGISDASAATFVATHGRVGWHDIAAALDAKPACARMTSYWHFQGCRYRKAAHTCAEPQHLASCSLPSHPARKGGLTQAAYALFLFIRDVCDGDLVGWIDHRLAGADPGVSTAERAEQMSAALIDPLKGIYGFGEKVWSMALADLLLAADPARERWVTTGAGMIVIDSLVHNFLHRTGTLRRFGAKHPYGPRCYGAGGCADIVRGLARRTDARQFNPTFPTCFPRFVQFAIWHFCSASGLSVCNGNTIDDRSRCQHLACPMFSECDRVALRGGCR